MGVGVSQRDVEEPATIDANFGFRNGGGAIGDKAVVCSQIRLP